MNTETTNTNPLSGVAAERKVAMTSTKHTILTVSAKPASEKGALDGFEAVCSCGYRMSTSLSEREARKLGFDHAEYMNRKETVR
jgi:hypothetical protein